MEEFVKVARADDLESGERMWLEFEEETVILFNINGAFYCIADVCTHDGGPLEDGELDGYEVECPRHGARFDVRTGAALCLPAVTPVPAYEVRVVDGDIYIENPDAW
ncbi:MAG: non-heme iron oxygenase ferredoxin subunit [Candidatus Promineifilaceae bacterium]